MIKLFGKNPFTLFYIVFGYIIIFSMWWGYLLMDKNETAYTEMVALNRINYDHSPQAIPYEQTTSYLKIQSKYRRQRLMVITEGGVFLILQILGLWQVRRIFGKELDLAAQQRNFLLSITHELKSPLANVKLSFQTILKRALEPTQKEKIITNALGDVVRLESLVDNILFAAKIEQDTHGFSNEEINMSDLVLYVVQKFIDNKKQVQVTTDVQEGLYYHTDQVGFTSVVMNLIENAIKYSDTGSKVEVMLAESPSDITLAVKDNGYGIPDSEKPKVFEKFYRIGSEDTRKTKGTGLGLYIVKRFVEIYSGKINLIDNSPSGSIFSLSLPK